MDKIKLKWNGFAANIGEYFRKVREDQKLFDVTLVTDDGHHIQAHEIILSAGSNFFSDIFLKTNNSNMLIYLKGIRSAELQHIADFMYNGEASINEEDITSFLETGKELQIKGLQTEIKGSLINSNENLDDFSDKLYSDKQFSDKQYSDNQYIDKKFSDEQYGNKKFSEKQYSDNQYSDEQYRDKKCGDEQHDNVKFERDLLQQYPVEQKVNIKEFEKYESNNTELDHKIDERIKKIAGLWTCKECGKTSTAKQHIKSHAETHLKGMSHNCHICSKAFTTRPNLQNHVNSIHSELLNCHLCEKSGMNKKAYYMHKQRNHKQ